MAGKGAAVGLPWACQLVADEPILAITSPASIAKLRGSRGLERWQSVCDCLEALGPEFAHYIHIKS